MVNRKTKDLIKEIKPGEVFVFGSNLSGIHGAGAAKMALQWGAIFGNGIGIQGNTYAIPTKSENIIRTLTVEEIKPYVTEFIQYAKDNPDKIFFVTEIGCGLAGLKYSDVAPLFKGAIEIENIHLPEKFWVEIL